MPYTSSYKFLGVINALEMISSNIDFMNYKFQNYTYVVTSTDTVDDGMRSKLLQLWQEKKTDLKRINDESSITEFGIICRLLAASKNIVPPNDLDSIKEVGYLMLSKALESDSFNKHAVGNLLLLLLESKSTLDKLGAEPSQLPIDEKSLRYFLIQEDPYVFTKRYNVDNIAAWLFFRYPTIIEYSALLLQYKKKIVDSLFNKSSSISDVVFKGMVEDLLIRRQLEEKYFLIAN